MRSFAPWCGALLTTALALLPGQAAAQRKAVGVVSQSDHGHIDSADAVTGANIYNCDTLETEAGGEMRVQVRSGQIFLPAASEGQLQEDLNGIEVYIDRGTVGFSGMAGAAIEIVAPAGVVRPLNGQEASGQVTITGPKEMLIQAIHGDLVLDNGGELRTIPQGQTAKVTFEEGSTPVCHVDQQGNQNQQPRNALQHRKIGFILIGAAAVGLPAYFLWRHANESPSAPQ